MASVMPHVIFGIHVARSGRTCPDRASVLTEYGENIKTRLGLHDVHEGFCSPNGLLLVEFLGDRPAPTPSPNGSRRSRAWR